jgi:predicted RNase H-like HicB family nuclease
LGFLKGVSGSHRLFRRNGIEEKINLQRAGAQAKPRSGEGSVRDSESEVGLQTMIKYEVIIYWSDEDEAYIAEAPELPGCTAHGASQEAALSNAQDAIRLWVDTAKELGDPIPEPRGRRLISA